MSALIRLTLFWRAKCVADEEEFREEEKNVGIFVALSVPARACAFFIRGTKTKIVKQIMVIHIRVIH